MKIFKIIKAKRELSRLRADFMHANYVGGPVGQLRRISAAKQELAELRKKG